jgi:hypothetical protein
VKETALKKERQMNEREKERLTSAEIPKSTALEIAEETATICWKMISPASITFSEPGAVRGMFCNSQCLTVRAFNIVSAVVKVLETMMTRVCSASRPCKALATSTGSTLARKRNVRPLDAEIAS